MTPSPVSPRLSRRAWLGVAVAAGLAGAGTAWWRLQPTPALDDALQDLWGRVFDGPTGESVAMASFQGRKLVLNFWATWCPPCVEELPMLDRFRAAHHARGWEVVGLAVDQPAAVRGFLQKRPLGFPVAMAGLEGSTLAKALGNATGGLPFTVVLDERGSVVQRKLGKLSEDDVAGWATLG